MNDRWSRTMIEEALRRVEELEKEAPLLLQYCPTCRCWVHTNHQLQITLNGGSIKNVSPFCPDCKIDTLEREP